MLSKTDFETGFPKVKHDAGVKVSVSESTVLQSIPLTTYKREQNRDIL